MVIKRNTLLERLKTLDVVVDSYHKALTVFPQFAAEILAWIAQQD